MSHVYLLCIRPRYRHAGHYIGYTTRDDVEERVSEHRSGRGSVLCRVAARAGHEIHLVRVWRDVPRRHELRLKGRSAVPLCPHCRRRP